MNDKKVNTFRPKPLFPAIARPSTKLSTETQSTSQIATIRHSENHSVLAESK